MCGAVGDSIRHRTFCCPATAEAVAEVVPRWLIEEGAHARDEDVFWNRAIFPHPGDIAAGAAVGGQLVGEEWVDGRWIESEGWGGWHAGWREPFHGWLFGDGSCDSSPVGELKRAASAVILVSEEGQAKRRLLATVPRSWPQSSQSSEYLAAALAVRFANGNFVYVGDCKGVIADLASPPARMLAASKMYAGVLMDTLARPTQRQQLLDAKWMPSHQTLDADANAEQRRDHEGNKCADEGAKAARSRHPRTEDQAGKEIEYYLKRAALVAKAIAVAMARFPPRGERLQRYAVEREKGGAGS